MVPGMIRARRCLWHLAVVAERSIVGFVVPLRTDSNPEQPCGLFLSTLSEASLKLGAPGMIRTSSFSLGRNCFIH